MKKLVVLFILLIFSNHFFGKHKKSVFFGDHVKHVKTLENGVLRIFMDLNGDFYPENIINKSEFKNKGKSQLKVWAKKHPIKFKEIAKSYNLLNTSYNLINYSILQDSIKADIANKINNHSLKQQTWIIHGFRKRLHKKIDDTTSNSTSFYDNSCGVNKINKYLSENSKNKQLIVELYWDGFYSGYFSTFSLIKFGFIFKFKATPSAENCGYSLRDLFTKLTDNDINIISHSTGTHVVASLLFNVKSKYNFETPKQNIKVALLASASPGIKLFKKYYKRNTSYNFREKDNYSLLNVINEKDIVLLKKGFGLKFTKILGNTSLGCNSKRESEKLGEYFIKKFPNSSYSEHYITNIKKSHYFTSYIKALESFDFLYN